MNKKIRFSLLTLLVMLCGTVFADDAYYTLDATDSSNGTTNNAYASTGTATVGSVEWVFEGNGTMNPWRLGGKNITNQDRAVYTTSVMDAAISSVKLEVGAANNITVNSLKLIVASDAAFLNVIDEVSKSFEANSVITFSPTSPATSWDENAYYKFVFNVSVSGSSNKFVEFKKVEFYKAASSEPEPTGYTVDFNKSIIVPSSNTASPVFQVSIGWTRIASSAAGDGYGPYYMRYTYGATDGVDASGALLANAQCAPQSTYDGTIEAVNDYLVTPKVSGTVTLQVKGSSSANSTYPSFVKFYAINDDATTVGDEITPTFSGDINNDDYVTATLTLTEATRIAIRAQWVYMDNFTATAAEVPEVKSLTVASVMNMEGKEGTSGTTTYFEQQSDGTLSVPLKVLLSNTGNVDFVAGATENYTLTLATASYSSGSKTYYDDATVAIPVSLAAGASDTIEVTFNIPYTSSWLYYFVKENVTGTTSSSSRYAGTTAYEPKFIFRAAESTSTSSLSATQAFGLISEETTKNFEIANTGTAPLTIKSITLPAGFTSANMPEIPAEGLVIAKGTTQALDITLPATTQGAFSGNLTIVYLDKNAAEQTYTLAFSGSVLPAGTWAADFSGESGIGYPAGSIAEGGINSDYQYADGAYNYYIKGRTSSSYASGSNMFITPKLHATAGQQLTFDVKGAYGSSYYAKVYVSTDRKTWGEPVGYFTYGETDGAEAIGYSDWVNKSISFAEEGDYYVAFSLYGEFKIDNIIGLTKADVAHDLYIKSVSWPDASVKSSTSLSKPSIDIIPLTDETAEAYTVKYVCGETVLAEGTPVALTASANSSKTFSFSWTPTVESTTAYPGTKIVFEFTDGTKIESETFDFTVTNEPIFHFVSSIPSSKWYEPSDVNTPITFGKTNQADKKTFYVYNWGSAPLTVKSIAVPAGFTATPAEQFTVAAFDENDMSAAAQAVEITFSATEAGTYSDDSLMVTYLDGTGAEKTFKLAISGTKLDPSKFYANFDDGGWPAGSVYQSNVSSSNGGTYSAPNYYITSSSTTNNIFVTPKLTAAAGDKLLFDAKLYSSSWSEGKVVVYAAATREEVLNAEEGTTRDTLFSVSGQDAENAMTTDFQTFEVTVPTAGDYFFGFEISNRPYVDEIYGLKPAAVAHDWTIASSSVPAEAMQNVAATATVNILNLGLADEAAGSYAATLYVNNEAVANADAVALPTSHKLSDAGTQLSFNFRYPKVGTFPVYIEVKAGDYSVKTDAIDVVFAAEVAIAEAIEVGTKSDNGRDYGFVDWYNNDGSDTRYTDIIYPAAKLTAAGIKAGDKINSIAFRSTSNSAKTLKAVVTSWVALSTGEVTLGTPDKASMTEVVVYNGEVALPEKFESVINISANPIVWDGTSDIRVYTEAVGQGSQQWLAARYDYDSGITMSYNGTSKAAPLAYFTLAAEPATFAGTVKNAEDAAVEGAIVTLISNDGDGVEYTGTTDAEGAYSINVIQTGRQYNVEVDAEGYEGASAIAVSFAEGSVTKDFVVDVPLIKKYVNDPGFELAEAIASNIATSGNAEGTDYEATGWKFISSAAWCNSAVFAYGAAPMLNGASAPATDESGKGGKALGITVGWSGAVTYQTSTAVTLPAGTYTLTAAAYNAGTAEQFKSLLGFIPTEGTSFVSNKNSFKLNEWVSDEVTFSLEQDTEGKFQIGGQAISGGSGANGKVFFDNLTLTFKSLLDGVLDELTAELTYAYSLKTEDRTAGLEAFNAAILAAEGLLESTDVAAIKAGIEALQAAENAFVIANMPIAEGKYYIYNIGTQKYLAAGANWGTHAIVNENGVDYEFAIADGKYTLDSQISNGGNSHFLNGEWNDGAAMGWTIAAVEGKEGVYTISNGEKFLTAGENGLVTLADDATADAAQWTVKTLEARIAELATATAEAPVDATFLIQDANFGRNDLRKSAWKIEASNQNLSGGEDGNGSVGNNCAESYHAVFTLTQTLTNVPAGKYKMTAQGFYRQDGDAVEDAPVFYANAKTIAFPVKTGSENSMTDASKSFNAGLYTIEPIEVVVGEDSILTIGAKGTATSQWVIWDNFRLSYYGEDPVLAGDANLNGEVTTSDAVAAVSFALGTETPSAKAFKAADVNNSGNITVADAVAIVNIALEIEEEATARGEMKAVNFLSMNGNALELMNSTKFVGFQMDVTLADGAMLNSVSLAERAADLQIAYNRIADNTYRIIAFSTSNATIEGNEGALFSLDITGNANISISNVEFADAAARAYALGFGEPTGIKGIYAGATNVESYTVGGVKNDKVRKGMNVVRTADGKVKKVFVK